MKVNFKNIILLVVIVAVMLIAVSLFNDFTKDQDEMILTDLHALIDNGLVTELKIDEENLVTGKKYVIEGTDPDTGAPVYKLNADGTRATVDFEFQLAYAYQAKAIEDKIIEINKTLDDANDIKLETPPPKATPWYLAYLPYIIIILVFIGLWIFVLRSSRDGGAGGKMNSFAKSKAKVMTNDKNAVKFADVLQVLTRKRQSLKRSLSS